jgi:glycine oxidase
MPASALAGTDAAVIGGGLIGLSVALALAKRGAAVRLFERGEPGRAASWAGAGMLAPYSESHDDPELTVLCSQSLNLYPAFAAALAEAGIDPRLALKGILTAAFDDGALARLAERSRRLRADGVACEMLDRSETLTLEPGIGKAVRGGLLVRDEGSVDNRRLGRALVDACAACGVSIVRDLDDVTVECDGRRVLGVRSTRGFSPSQWVVNAAGAWAGAVPGIPDWARPPVDPVKGQMLALAAPSGLFGRPIWVPGAYLVPRGDGRLLVGATVERKGFDERVTAEGIRTLLHAAIESVPALCDFALTETWAGLRPGTPDGRPFIGPTPVDGLLLATGHFRNGILLAPVTAQLIADFVETRDERPLQPWLPLRMNPPSRRMTHA